MKQENTMKIKIAGIAVSLLCAQMATASVITGASGSNLGGVTTNVDLTATGPVDWAEWNTTVGTPTQSKSGGTAISDLVITKGTASYVSQATANILYSWTNGDPTAAVTGSNPTDPQFRSASGADLVGSGASESISIVGTTALQTVTLWGTSLKVGATITASLSGSSDAVTQIVRFDTATDNVWTYSVSFQADTAGDLLTLTVNPYDSWTGNTTQERLGIGAATVIPEPATLGMVVATGVGMIFVRRKFMM